MDALVVIVLHESRYLHLELPRRRVLRVPQPLALERAEPPLDPHVVGPPRLAVHALRDPEPREQRNVLVGAEDASLVGVHDPGRAPARERLPGAGADLARAHRVREPPADDVAAVPVDDRGQVHVAAPQLHVGYVERPDLVGEEHGLAPQQVREPLGLLRRPGQRRHGRRRLDPHPPHQVARLPARRRQAGVREEAGELPRAVLGVVDVQRVDPPRPLLVPLAPVLGGPLGRVVRAAPADAQQLAGALAREPLGRLSGRLPALPGRSRARRETAGGSRARA